MQSLTQLPIYGNTVILKNAKFKMSEPKFSVVSVLTFSCHGYHKFYPGEENFWFCNRTSVSHPVTAELNLLSLWQA